MHARSSSLTSAAWFLIVVTAISIVSQPALGQPGCGSGAPAGEIAPPESSARPGPDASLWYQHVQALADPALEGRVPGTRGMELAAEYIESRLRAYGLQPAFPDSSRAQPVLLESGHARPAPLGSGGALPSDVSGSYRQWLTIDGMRPEGVSTANVAGILPGKGRLKDEYLVIGAHYDHLGRNQGGPGAREDSPILLGADDNASGTAAVLILAKRLAALYQVAPASADLRPIVFVTFTAEERGRIGSRRFVQSPPVPLRAIHAMLNLDMIGHMQEGRVSLSGFGTASEFPGLLGELLAESGLRVTTEPGSGASDQMSFLEAGIPALYAMTGWHDEIHQPTDVPSTLNPSDAVKVIDLAEQITRRLAEHSGALTFVAQPDIAGAVCSALQPPAAAVENVLPDTPAGHCVAAFLEAFNSGDGVRIADFENHRRAASARDRRPVQDRVDQLQQVHVDLGDLALVRVLSADPTEIRILALSSRESAKWSVEFEFEDQAPYGLDTLRLRPYSALDAEGSGAAVCGSPPRTRDETEGAPSAKDEPAALLDTPAGRCVAAYLDAFNSEDDERAREFEKRYRAASARGNRSLQDRLDQLHQIHDDLGDLTLLRVVSISPAEIAVLALSSRTGEAWSLGFEFEEQPPNGLMVLRIVPSSEPEDSEIYTKPIDEALRRDTIRQIGDLLRDGYVDPDIGKRMAEALAEHEAAGHYSAITSAADLAQRLTTDVLAVYSDKHFSIVPFSGPSAPSGCASVSGAQDNFSFRTAELLPGNIGYIKFDMFLGSDEARQAAAEALAAVAGCDALIFDLRGNIGGSPRMVGFIASYLFDKPTHMDSFFDRLNESTLEIWTTDSIPGQRFPNEMPVYILTSASTASAAEGFAYDLKHLGRATVVGATTSGAAHMVTDRIINERFLVHLPYLREVNPITKGNWEGVGVEPDIKVPAPEALDAALQDAAEKLRGQRKAAVPAVGG